MGALIRSEWIKFRSVRSTLVTLVLAGVLVVLVAVIAATRVDRGSSGVTHLGDLTGGVIVASLIFGVLGVQILGQEYRFETIRPTFTAMPRRWRVLVAKLVVVTTACGAIAVLMVGASWMIGTLLIDGFETDGMDRRVALGIVLFSMGWSALGLGVGAIVRQPIAGILILLGEAFVVESLIGALLPALGTWRPFMNGFQMTFRSEGSEQSGVIGLHSVLGGGLYFFAVAAALWLLGAVLANRRDA